MTDVVVRFARRKAIWETPDVATICKVEFSDAVGEPDLRPSVYKIEASQLVRTYAEHAVIAAIDPPGSARAIDVPAETLTLLPDPPEVMNAKQFRHAAETHREIDLPNEEALLTLVASICLGLHQRKREILRADVNGYVLGRLSNRDREWVDASDSSSAKAWVQKLAKKAASKAMATTGAGNAAAADEAARRPLVAAAAGSAESGDRRGRTKSRSDDVVAELTASRIRGELGDAAWKMVEPLRERFAAALPGAERDAVRADMQWLLDRINNTQ